uniref:Uncharacterized protein n=1 Tax=Chrysotila carterae TaxID=13221 RepID=A0A7S4FB95_CHRCT
MNACDSTRRARRATTSTAHETDQRASNRSSRQQSAVSGEKEKLRSLMSAIFESGVDDAAWRERLLAERRWQKECGASTCAPVCGSKGRKLRSIEPEPYRSSAEALGLRDYSTGTHANRQ